MVRVAADRHIDNGAPGAAVWFVVVVGVLRITMHFHGCGSLKEKRSLVKSILGKASNRFNVSASEVSAHDLLQRAGLAFTTAGTDGAFVNSVMDRVLNFVDGLGYGEIIDNDMELVSFSDDV